MIRVFVKDEKIVKVINGTYIGKYEGPSGSTYFDTDYDITDNLAYENGNIILFKDSQSIQDEKIALESMETRNEYQQERLDYILSIL